MSQKDISGWFVVEFTSASCLQNNSRFLERLHRTFVISLDPTLATYAAFCQLFTRTVNLKCHMAQNINAFWVERASLSFVFLPPTFFPSFVYKCNYPHVNSSYLEIIWEYYCNQRCCPHPRQRQIVCCHAFQCSCTMLVHSPSFLN